MKYILKNSLMLFITIYAMASCRKMDSKYKDLVVTGGLTYPGKPVAPRIYTGNNRVKISWLKGADPSVVSARVYWNNFADSVTVPMTSTDDSVSVIIDHLAEKIYTFMIRTIDGKGNASIPVEITGASFGEKYQAQLLSRPVHSTLVDAKGNASIKWGKADILNGAFATEVKYTDTAGDIKFKSFPVDVPTSALTDLKPGTGYEYRTMYKPDSTSIDSFYTSYTTSTYFSFDKKDWSIKDFSSEYPGRDDTKVTNFIDGTDGTRWHTNSGPRYPDHYATVDMGVSRTIAKIGVWTTTYDQPAGENDKRAPSRIKFYVSNDNVNWIDLGEHSFKNAFVGEQTYLIPGLPQGRYLKFQATAPGTDDNWCVMGEISAYGF